MAVIRVARDGGSQIVKHALSLMHTLCTFPVAWRSIHTGGKICLHPPEIVQITNIFNILFLGSIRSCQKALLNYDRNLLRDLAAQQFLQDTEEDGANLEEEDKDEAM